MWRIALYVAAGGLGLLALFGLAVWVGRRLRDERLELDREWNELYEHRGMKE